MDSKLFKELEVELKKIEEYKADYVKKEKMYPNDSYGVVINAIDNTENHIKRAIARAIFPDKVQELQKWIGCLYEAYKCDNRITWDVISEQVVYELFKEQALKEIKEGAE